MRVEQSPLPATGNRLDRLPLWRDAREYEAATSELPAPAPNADDPIFYPAPPAPWPRVFPGL